MIVVQTDWFPEAEHSELYHLAGPGGDIDSTNGTYTNEIGDTGVMLQVRAGGPYIGFQNDISLLYQDSSIHLAYTNTDEQVRLSASQPTVGIVAPRDKNPQIVMWDPELYSLESFEDLGDQLRANDGTLLYFEGATYIDYLLGKGWVSEDQIDASYDGSPARFIAEGNLVQQGFASAEPYQYQNEFEDWGKPVDFMLIHDSGLEMYPQLIAGKPDIIEEYRGCWELFVPMVQQAQVDYAADPSATNAQIVEIVAALDSFWQYSPGVAQYSHDAQLELGLISNGPNDTIGDFDIARVNEVIALLADIYGPQGLETWDPDVTATDIVTNEFIDPSIGLPSMDTEAMAMATLAEVCPAMIVVQTDWFPEAEHSELYHLAGPGGDIDTTNGTYTNEIGDTGVMLQVRAGGPYIGFQNDISLLYQDSSIHLAYTNTDEQVRLSASQPTVGIVAPRDKNPQIVMWDPELYSLESFEDLGDQLRANDGTLLYFEGATYIDYLLGKGWVSEDQIDASYDGSPARFIAEGNLVQQGFASAEPYQYQNEFEDWGKPVDFMLIHDSGLEMYPQLIAGKPDIIEEYRGCWELFVPMVQQAQVDYAADPSATNAQIVEIVAALDSFWQYSPGVAQYSHDAQLELGLISNGPNDTIGDFDIARVNEVIALLADIYGPQGLETWDPDVTATDIVTNEFIDPSIGLP
ncbi:MAG: hypothetical protein F4Y83_09660 [Acidimicrobiia bacterium]|nr:hypothetical protein [Acidimicrobiia bacterium]MYG92020.1 hypothetical protein [Acidimicrobiia bacterium]